MHIGFMFTGYPTRPSTTSTTNTTSSPQFRARRPRPSFLKAIPAALSALALGLASVPSDAAVTGSSRFLPTFLVYYGGGPTLTAADAPTLAKFDLLDIDRFRYLQIDNGTWAAIKAYNPAAQIYLYEMGAESANYQDSSNQLSLNSLGRFNVSRNHPMGSLNGNHPELFLTDAGGNRIYSSGYSDPASNRYMHLMDFGSSAYQSYWVSAVKADINDQPWRADGVFADVCVSSAGSGGYNAVSTKYPDDTAWSAAMNSFLSGVSGGLHGFGQKLWCNKGDSRTAGGSAAWKALDASADHPDVLLEEGAFAVGWGAAVQFYPEAEWRNQVDILGAITNTRLAMMSHTQLAPGQSGTDNWGKPVSFWQTFYYAMGSVLLGKNGTLNNTYWMFNPGTNFNYDSMVWFDEYDQIDLGKPMGLYTVSSTGGVNVYWREYERGYVAVNPTATDVAAFAFPQPVKPITHDNLLAQSTIAQVTSVALKGHNAAIVLKTTLSGGGSTGADTTAPSTPAGLTAVAVSTAQINLAWTASTDNVGVTGYKVYSNGTLRNALGNVLSMPDTGLAAGSTYSYTVQAVDAAGNASGQSQSVSATTFAAGGGADTTAPSTPTNLVASIVTASAVTLAWGASTDNVGVTGYRVYANDVLVATVGATTYAQSGLASNTQYRYRVAAVDAAGNVSASTASITVRTKRK